VPLVPERRFRVDQLEVVVHADGAAVAAAAADQAAATIREAVRARGVANAMFATGNSQLAFVDTLTRLPDVPWDDVVVFHMDEYVGVDEQHRAGFRRWIRERITERVQPGTAHYLDGTAPDPDAECDRYAGLLAHHPLDLCCLGIGENGHLAFNDPPVADFADGRDVKVVELDRACREQQVGEGHFPDIDAVPATAMTVTVPALLRARRVLAVVPEQRKAPAVLAALTGPVATSCPASALRTTSGATLHLDPGSACLLPVAPQ
jgi:glucosamine-6-phosphate deaminase